LIVVDVLLLLIPAATIDVVVFTVFVVFVVVAVQKIVIRPVTRC
jgi:hypothetical protein